ncbi:6170_t:CDS:1, partial [Racocetra persica]
QHSIFLSMSPQRSTPLRSTVSYWQGCQLISNRNQYESHSYHYFETLLRQNHHRSETPPYRNNHHFVTPPCRNQYHSNIPPNPNLKLQIRMLIEIIKMPGVIVEDLFHQQTN